MAKATKQEIKPKKKPSVSKSKKGTNSKIEDLNNEFIIEELKLNSKELEVLKYISSFPDVLEQSAKELSPYLLANYLYTLVKSYNSFYQDHPVITENEKNLRNFRIQMSRLVSVIIEKGMRILGIEMPEKM